MRLGIHLSTLYPHYIAPVAPSRHHHPSSHTAAVDRFLTRVCSNPAYYTSADMKLFLESEFEVMKKQKVNSINEILKITNYVSFF